MDKEDRLSLVSFNQKPTVLFGFKGKESKELIERQLLKLKGEGGTNIVAGLKRADQLLGSRKQKG